MERIVVENEHLVGTDYSGLTLDQFSAMGSTFENCAFDRVRIGDAGFGAGTEQSRYVGCSFDQAALTSLGGYVRFVDCTFRNARFPGCSPDYLEFIDCSFTGKITGLSLHGVPMPAQNRYRSVVAALARQGEPEPPGYRELTLRERNEIRGNDFSAADLIRVNFRRGVDLTAQRLPTGADYLYLPDAETAILHALAALDAESSPEAGQAATFLSDLLKWEIGAGQRQLLLRPRDFERRKVVPPAIQLAIDLLSAARRESDQASGSAASPPA